MRRAVLILMAVALFLAMVVIFWPPKPSPERSTECTEADRACLEWDDIRESEWRTD